MNSSKYSVYELWVAGESSPFYVGKGLNGRPYAHINLAKNGDMSFKSKKIRKAWKMNFPIIIKHVFRTDIEQEAFNEEIRLINYYGRRDKNTGVLVNFTDGGEGTSGHIKTKETCRKLSKLNRGRVFTEEHRKNLSDAHKGKTLPEEQRRKIGEASKGHVKSEETRRKLSEALKGRKLSEAQRQSLMRANIGRVHSEETRRKISESGKGRITSEETCRKISLAKKGKPRGPLSEETRRKMSESRTGKIRGPYKTKEKAKLDEVAVILPQENLND